MKNLQNPFNHFFNEFTDTYGQNLFENDQLP